MSTLNWAYSVYQAVRVGEAFENCVMCYSDSNRIRFERIQIALHTDQEGTKTGLRIELKILLLFQRLELTIQLKC